MTPIVSGGGGGGSQTVLTATVTLTNAQIKTLLATPVAIATPAAGYGIAPVRIGLVLDDTHGIYVDPDGAGNGSIISFMPDPVSGATTLNLMLDDAGIGAPGIGIYPTVLSVSGFAWGLLENGGPAPTTALGIAKRGASEYIGGGAGNTLKVTTWYIGVPLT